MAFVPLLEVWTLEAAFADEVAVGDLLRWGFTVEFGQLLIQAVEEVGLGCQYFLQYRFNGPKFCSDRSKLLSQGGPKFFTSGLVTLLPLLPNLKALLLIPSCIVQISSAEPPLLLIVHDVS